MYHTRDSYVKVFPSSQCVVNIYKLYIMENNFCLHNVLCIVNQNFYRSFNRHS